MTKGVPRRAGAAYKAEETCFAAEGYGRTFGCLAIPVKRHNCAVFMNAWHKRVGRELLKEVQAEVTDEREHCDQKKTGPDQKVCRKFRRLDLFFVHRVPCVPRDRFDFAPAGRDTTPIPADGFGSPDNGVAATPTACFAASFSAAV